MTYTSDHVQKLCDVQERPANIGENEQRRIIMIKYNTLKECFARASEAVRRAVQLPVEVEKQRALRIRLVRLCALSRACVWCAPERAHGGGRGSRAARGPADADRLVRPKFIIKGGCL